VDKLVYAAALERSGGACEICGSSQGVELHHCIFGQGKRKQCERLETVMFLCFEHHRGNKGVHNYQPLNMQLKKLVSDRLQAAGLEGEELKRALGGRFY